MILQALIWIALSVAFAALLRLAGPQSWENALRFAGVSWLPWVVLAPAVYWFSGRFPLEKAQLWKSIPAHVLGCATCVALTISIATYVGYISRPPGRFEERRPPFNHPPGEFDSATHVPGNSAVFVPPALEAAPPEPTDPQSVARRERFERFGRGPFPRRSGPPWWPFLGVTLIRANFDAAVYLIVVVAAHALAFYRRAQEREQHAIALAAGLTRAKLDALRLQLHPHFLFNTLNAISTLVHRDANAADELIGDLSDLLRVSLHTTDHEVPLFRELELLDRYLAIEKCRLGDRLQIEKQIDPSAENGLVPTFLLQPLVENAVRHGIEPRIAPGQVRIVATRNGDRLQLSVEDNGVGFTSKTTAKPERHGIGLSNTEQRLRALHGDAATLAIQAPETGGVVVRIELPFSLRRAAGAASEAPAAETPA